MHADPLDPRRTLFIAPTSVERLRDYIDTAPGPGLRCRLVERIDANDAAQSVGAPCRGADTARRYRLTLEEETGPRAAIVEIAGDDDRAYVLRLDGRALPDSLPSRDFVGGVVSILGFLLCIGAFDNQASLELMLAGLGQLALALAIIGFVLLGLVEVTHRVFGDLHPRPWQSFLLRVDEQLDETVGALGGARVSMR